MAKVPDEVKKIRWRNRYSQGRNRDIYDAYIAGELIKDIASRFHLCPSMIWHIVRQVSAALTQQQQAEKN